MSYRLSSSSVFYGASIYEMQFASENPDLIVIEKEPELDFICERLTRLLPPMGFEEIKRRCKINKVNACVNKDGRIIAPELIVVWGDGFNISWRKE